MSWMIAFKFQLWEQLVSQFCFGREQGGQDKRYGDLGFKIELPEFCSTLQAEGFIDWEYEVERIFDYKEVPNCMEVKLVAIKLKARVTHLFGGKW